MGRMSGENILAAMKKAKAKTEVLKFAPHPEDLPLEILKPHPDNRFADQDEDSDIDEIKDNILQVGLINPVAVNHKDGVYWILSGERRDRALRKIQAENPDKFKYVRCSVYENLTRAEELQIIYSANLKARHYTGGKRLEYFTQLKSMLEDEKAAGRYDGPVQSGIAEIMGISERQARKYDSINELLTKTEKKRVATNEISVDNAYALAVQRKQTDKPTKADPKPGQPQHDRQKPKRTKDKVTPTGGDNTEARQREQINMLCGQIKTNLAQLIFLLKATDTDNNLLDKAIAFQNFITGR